MEKTLITDKQGLTCNTPDLKPCQNSLTLDLMQHMRKILFTPPPPRKSPLTLVLAAATFTVYLLTLFNLLINSFHIFCIAGLVVFCFTSVNNDVRHHYSFLSVYNA
jgi:hypothetical protein